MVKRICGVCGCEFEARQADINRDGANGVVNLVKHFDSLKIRQKTPLDILIKINEVVMKNSIIEIDGIKYKLVPENENDGDYGDWAHDWFDLKSFNGYYVNANSIINECKVSVIDGRQNTCKTKKQAEAIIAWCQLTHLIAQPCVNGDWKPNWNDNKIEKWVVVYRNNELSVDYFLVTPLFLVFKEKEIAEKFLNKYRSYIEQAAPLLFGVEI